MGDGFSPGRFRRVAVAAAVLFVFVAGAVGVARGERSQKGNLTVFLDGGLTPLALPRDRPAPVAVHLEGGLLTNDRSLLPRVTRIELGLPAEGVVSTLGLPVCPPARLRNAKPAEALAACRGALVGRGRLEAQVHIPPQDAFPIEARLLAFNGRVAGSRAVILHAYSSDPPIAAVLPFRLRHAGGRFGLVMTAKLPPALGPWPHLANFELTLHRRYRFGGTRHSYLSASCPIPPSLTAGFASIARVRFSLAGGGRIETGITRGCRAR